MPVWLPRIHFRGSHRDGPGPFWASRRTCRARFRRSWLTRVKGARRIRHKGQIMMGRPKYVPRRWRCALSSRQARLSAIRPRAVVATDHWLLAPELAAGIRRREAPTMLLGCALRRFDSAALTDGRCSGGFTPEATGVARRADAPKLSALPRAPCGFSARRGWRWDSHRPSAGEPFEPDAIDWSGMRALSEWPTTRPETSINATASGRIYSPIEPHRLFLCGGCRRIGLSLVVYTATCRTELVSQVLQIGHLRSWVPGRASAQAQLL